MMGNYHIRFWEQLHSALILLFFMVMPRYQITFLTQNLVCAYLKKETTNFFCESHLALLSKLPDKPIIGPKSNSGYSRYKYEREGPYNNLIGYL